MVTSTVVRFRSLFTLPLSLVVLLAICIGSTPVATAAQVARGPVLHEVVAIGSLPSEIIVSGHGFTPGGRVYIALYDQWGVILHETRWVTASTRSFQPPQDLPPGESFSFDSGGNIAEVFTVDWGPMDTAPGARQFASTEDVDCASAVMVRAYDRSSATWSAILNVDLGCLPSWMPPLGDPRSRF